MSCHHQHPYYFTFSVHYLCALVYIIKRSYGEKIYQKLGARKGSLSAKFLLFSVQQLT